MHNGEIFKSLIKYVTYTFPVYVTVFLGRPVRVTLRLTVYRQSVHLGDKPLDTHDQ
jgi:hypothetical protein